jgi:UDP-N-acetylmuramoyl-L-alanyl-D-glutamate--2,6-diaminopimelate ligase
MTLSKILEGVQVAKMFHTMYGKMVVTHEVQIRNIHYDSRKIQKGDMFVAIRGSAADGHNYITAAIANGASAVVVEDDTALPDAYFMHAGVVKIVVGNSRHTLALMAANFYNHPAKQLKLIGVTGTNGKTTTTYLIKHILEHSNASLSGKIGLIGTIEYHIGEQKFPATHTTPESLELQQLFAQMVADGCTYAVMETSSHALHQGRVHGLDFAAGVFTNLTQDHLDYHGTMEEYFRAKKILFDGLTSEAWAVANVDDAWGMKMLEGIHAQAVSYGITSEALVKAKNVSLSMTGTRFFLEHGCEETEISSPLVGSFNVYNILAASSVAISLGIEKSSIRDSIATLASVPGRFEKIASSKGWTAIIDYAHTPDALEKCLSTIHDILPRDRKNSIITVFGAGGDRDVTKRPFMGSVVDAMSDIVIVTSDNPRTENPATIIDDIRKGIKRQDRLYVEPDRREAIFKGLSMAAAGDVVLIAGKGHEDYQIIGTTKHHFSDREIVREWMTADH